MRTFRILAKLASYPEADMLAHMAEMTAALEADGMLKGKPLRHLRDFMKELGQGELLSLQEDYVMLFDRAREHSLHLFEHVHGESRYRGQAMVNLAGLYEEKGLKIQSGELPDYLPAFLEFLSVCEPLEAQALLDQAVHVIATIGAKLKKRGGGYHTVFDAIITLSKAKLDKEAITKAAASSLPAEEEDLEALDKEWAEPEAFGDDCTLCDTNTGSLGPVAGGTQ